MSVQPKIAVVFYSTYGHVTKLAEEVKKGLESKNAKVDIFLFPETLSDEVLAKMHAASKPDYPELTDPTKLKEYDGFAFGFPTRYGRAPAQVNAFFDKTGGMWAAGDLVGKFSTVFTSTASQHGGQETTAFTTFPFFTHHGIIYVAPGYAMNAELTDLEEIVGGSPYGSAAIAGSDGSRQLTAKELKIAEYQGSYFAGVVSTFKKGASSDKDDSKDTTAAAATTKEGEKTTGAEGQEAAAAQQNATTEENNNQEQANSKPEEKKKGGLFALCCGSKAQEKNFS